MDIFEAIEKRHSYRASFKDEEVSQEDLIKIVEAGLKAPSGKNAQTTEFVIIRNQEILDKIGEMHPKQVMKDAKAMIACLIDKEPEAIYEGFSFQLEDCSAAVENMLLATTALGYATVWIDGWMRVDGRNEAIAELIEAPKGKVVQVLLPIGVPAEEVKRPIKKTFNERARFLD